MYLLSRLRVYVNRLALPLIPLPKPFSFIGADASRSLCREIAASGAQRVLIITDAVLARLGVIAPLVQTLREAGVGVDIYSDVEPDPGTELVMAGVDKLKAADAQAVLAIGGGSSIDCAKAILLCHANACEPARLKGLWLYAAPRKKCLPFYAVPTTAGTGSEVTIAAVVSDKVARTKYAIIDPKMVPSMVALDPKLMLGLPPQVTAPTGMDALTHAVEAYISSMATAETDELAQTATATIARCLPKVYADGSNVELRERMAIASCMAGLAFTRAGVGYVHAFAHQLGGLYHVPHGLANAVVMPHVLDFSLPACTPRLAALARAAGLSESGEAAQARAFVALIRRLNQDMGIPATIKDLRREDFETIIDRAFAEAHGTYGVPRYLSRADARDLLQKLLP